MTPDLTPRQKSVLDYIICHQQKHQLSPTVREIAAVLVRDLLPKATLKRVRRTRSELVPDPANPAYPPMVFKGPERKQVSILGKLVGVIRRV